ncbi:MAG TPA: carboxypeptidase-like regulatory domain-containing protein [Thermoanaerobaculia bacterium]|nr:carboxypeptidase-like regulatory domain-containing protein [Thermoanaerobaculia bacterium]
MRRVRVIAFAAALTVIAAPAQPEVALPSVPQILGNVTNAARPVANALVIALNLGNFEAIRTYTAADGSFLLPPIQAGVYRIIAVKYGFAPASATVVPGQASHRVNLRMLSEKQAAGRKKTNQEIWELRGSLPADVLREIDLVMASPQQTAGYDVPRFRGEMVSMTGVADAKQAATFAHTGVGVHSRLGESWQIGIRGDMQRIDDPTDERPFGDSAAEAAVMEMELRSSPTTAYRVASTQSSWTYREGADPDRRQAAVRSHNFEWEYGDARVKVRYFAHDNLFQSMPGSDIIEIAGGTSVLHTRRNDLGVSLRVRQESVRSSNLETLRTADLAASGSVALVPEFSVQYGVASRLGIDRSEWAPRTGFEWRITEDTSLIGSAAYKVMDRLPAAALPSLVAWADDHYALPRYSYSFGVVSSRNAANKLSVVGTVSAVDVPLRVVFDDGFTQFWDGLYVESGDVRRDVRLAYRRDFGSNFAIDIATTAGTATPRQTSEGAEKLYVTSDMQTIFVPTGTTLAFSYREIQQPHHDEGRDYHSARVNVRMAQSLYLPLDVKLLLGLELVRVANSPFLLDPMLSDQTARRYVGGLAVNF